MCFYTFMLMPTDSGLDWTDGFQLSPVRISDITVWTEQSVWTDPSVWTGPPVWTDSSVWTGPIF